MELDFATHMADLKACGNGGFSIKWEWCIWVAAGYKD
jgi:hypothetical protein